MKRLRTLVVDDVELARQKLVRALSKHADVEVVGEAANGAEMIKAIGHLQPTLMFLDVSMPEQGGFSALSELPAEQYPLVVFVTAYAQFALDAFRVEAIDYLLKPVDPVLLDQALGRVRRRLAEPGIAEIHKISSSASYPDRLTVRTDTGLRILPLASIDWIETVRNYVAIHCGREVIIVRSTLHGLLAQLNPKCFARIHRSAVVNLKQIREVRPSSNGDQRLVLNDGTELMVSRTHREALLLLLSR